MAMITRVVDSYASFYRSGARKDSAYARLRPLSIVADCLLKAPAHTDRESLSLIAQGEINAFLDRVRNDHDSASGWLPLYKEPAAQREAVEQFVQLFLEEVFDDYSKGSRALLRKYLNRLKNGCEAYYIKTYAYRSKSQDTDTEKAAPQE
ncbi:hypothetical protein [Heliorestis convoluta]|uniref:Type I-D CRISPR-associated protein Cas10d/Csc3 n=1 Tax=Heliorestis convoluta TaxID=356322 RepID=A0A5Q2N4X8_9FIRM|nr:hypothetical protein [Heliorestis convoluta]QGG48993.1 type I-D CRISPR-associated protein Cas10d/Csc3 [Heliorestis convoluta]